MIIIKFLDFTNRNLINNDIVNWIDGFKCNNHSVYAQSSESPLKDDNDFDQGFNVVNQSNSSIPLDNTDNENVINDKMVIPENSPSSNNNKIPNLDSTPNQEFHWLC